MLYYLFKYLDKFDLPGAGVFHYISFRAVAAALISLLFATIIGKRIIRYLQKKQIGETIRDLGLEGQMQKKGTPTMGGIIIILSILIPTLLFADILNTYIILMIVTTVWLGFMGFLDDYIKVFKKNKEGMAGRFKILGQISLGLIVGLTLYFSNSNVVREKTVRENHVIAMEKIRGMDKVVMQKNYVYQDVKSTKTTIPFYKNNEFDYKWIVSFLGSAADKWKWLVFVVAVIFIITAVSNGANLTDGMDGLCSGVSAVNGTVLGILAYLSGNMIYADYLNIMYLPGSGELVVFMSAFIGAMVGFMWYNSFPAQVFMGDTGSLTIGGILAVYAIIIRKELLIPILCGIYFAESLSVIIQVSYFKYTKKKFGEGRRIFLMAPLHHHYQKKGYPESKIVIRFWIIAIILGIITIATLKIR
jgi:phospho-N-acetylmuramoyl-pentapeptide-transferase